MAARNPVRYVAPVAIIAVAVAVALLVRSGLGVKHAATPPLAHQLRVAHAALDRQLFYVIKPGDSLSMVSVKTGVSIATLQALNPSITDPDALQAGQRIRLRP